MVDKFEKKLDKHYTYVCKEDIGIDFKNNIGWFIARREHEPGKKPEFDQSFRDIALGLSEEEAKAGVIELQAEEMKRRAQTASQHSTTVDLTAEAAKQNAKEKLEQLKSQKNVLEQMLAKIKKDIKYTRQIIAENSVGRPGRNNSDHHTKIRITEADPHSLK